VVRFDFAIKKRLKFCFTITVVRLKFRYSY